MGSISIIGLVITIISIFINIVCFILFISTHAAIKNNKNWDTFYNDVQVELDKKNITVSEEELYHMVQKINSISGITLLIGLVTMILGITLLVL